MQFAFAHAHSTLHLKFNIASSRAPEIQHFHQGFILMARILSMVMLYWQEGSRCTFDEIHLDGNGLTSKQEKKIEQQANKIGSKQANEPARKQRKEASTHADTAALMCLADSEACAHACTHVIHLQRIHNEQRLASLSRSTSSGQSRTRSQQSCHGTRPARWRWIHAARPGLR